MFRLGSLRVLRSMASAATSRAPVSLFPFRSLSSSSSAFASLPLSTLPSAHACASLRLPRALMTPMGRSVVGHAAHPGPTSPLLPLQPSRGLKTRARQIKRRYRTKSTYKLKSKKAVLARFKAVGGKDGTKLKYWRRGRVHNSQAKTQKQHRQLRRPKYLTGGKVLKKYKRAMLVS